MLKLASVIWGDNYLLFSFSLKVVKSARMPKENTLQLKTKKKSVKRLQRKHQSSGSKRVCIIHFAKNKSETKVKPLTEYSFSKIKEIALLRQSSNNKSQGLIISVKTCLKNLIFWFMEIIASATRTLRTYPV